jgi:hypothetical protein
MDGNRPDVLTLQAESASRPLFSSAWTCTSESNGRTVEVSGTTCTTFADSSRISWAVTTTTGRRRPALPTSRRSEIEVDNVTRGQHRAGSSPPRSKEPQVTAHPLLTESSGDSDRLPDRGPGLSSQLLEFIVGLAKEGLKRTEQQQTAQ